MSSYVIKCLLPNDENVEVIENTVKKIGAAVVCSGKIGVYDLNGEQSQMTFDEIAESFQFEYISRLMFLHEKDLRNIVSSCYWCPNHIVSETQETSACINKYLADGYINEHISIRRIGVVNGVDVGSGVFAEHPLPVDTYIGEYAGLVSASSSSSSSSSDSYSFLYPSADGGFEINASEFGNLIRFVNHSNKPNAEFRRVYFAGLMHIVVFLSRAVAAGEQVTVSYGKTYWEHKGIVPADI